MKSSGLSGRFLSEVNNEFIAGQPNDYGALCAMLLIRQFLMQSAIGLANP
jgi:hypothetical protein